MASSYLYQIAYCKQKRTSRKFQNVYRRSTILQIAVNEIFDNKAMKPQVNHRLHSVEHKICRVDIRLLGIKRCFFYVFVVRINFLLYDQHFFEIYIYAGFYMTSNPYIAPRRRFAVVGFPVAFQRNAMKDDKCGTANDSNERITSAHRSRHC